MSDDHTHRDDTLATDEPSVSHQRSPEGDEPGDASLDRPPATGDPLEQELSELLGASDGRALHALEGSILAAKYQLEALLGEGGMGQVYKARHLQTGGALAVKVLRATSAHDPDAQRRFQTEARNAAALRHPNTVRTTDFGADQGMLYLVMEYIDGVPLSQVLSEQGALPWQRVRHILAQVIKALWEAHEHATRIVHRDIKPANILLCDVPGDPDFVRVADFGISRTLEATGSVSQSVIGSPHTMAPEQWRGDPVDGRTDLYAVGCTAYQMLSGQPVFPGETFASLSYHHLFQTPTPLRELAASDVPDWLIGWVEQMMAKDAADRFATAADALDALQRGEDGIVSGVVDTIDASKLPATGHPGTAATTPTRPSEAPNRRPRILMATGLAVLIAAAAAGAFLLMRAGPASTPSEHGASGQAEAAASVGDDVPYRSRCASPHVTSPCSEGHHAWCDADDLQVACCMQGMVPVGQDGMCTCAPGGAEEGPAREAGCPGPDDPNGDLATRTRASIQATMGSAKSQWKTCYELALNGDGPQPRGGFVLDLSVGPVGEVVMARIKEGAFPDPDVQACMLDTVRLLRFDPPVNGWMKISYPIHLETKPDADGDQDRDGGER